MKLHFIFIIFQYLWKSHYAETVSGCTMNSNQQRRTHYPEKTSVTLSCANQGFILVRNLTFGVHKSLDITSGTPLCSYQPGDCTTRTTFIGMECNGLTSCDLDLNPQYLHICSQYSDYMVLDYSCLQGPSLSVCEHNSISSTLITESSKKEHRLFLRSPHYPNEYENSLNCSCQIQTSRSDVKFLDFYLEERDEMSQCSRDRLQIGNRSYCGSTLDDHKQINSHFTLNSSTELTFKSNDVITRKGFWLMMTSEQPLHVSCSNLLDTSLLTTTTPMTMMTTTIISTSNSMITKTSLSSSSSSMSMTLSTNVDSSRTNSNQKRRHALSYVLLLTIIFVVILLLLNLILMILCWRQKRLKQSIDPKRNCNHRPFFCSFRSCSSSSSSVTYGETPVLNSLDTQKPSSTSTRYIFQPNQSHLETTPSTSTTSPYEDLHDSLTLQKSKSHSQDPTLYMQQRQLTSPYAGYNRMIHFPPAPIRCHSSTPAQTFYPPQPFFDCQHIYETIQDGQCPYQRLSSTLRRPPPPPISPSSTCTCYCPHHPPPIEPNPETLV